LGFHELYLFLRESISLNLTCQMDSILSPGFFHGKIKLIGILLFRLLPENLRLTVDIKSRFQKYITVMHLFRVPEWLPPSYESPWHEGGSPSSSPRAHTFFWTHCKRQRTKVIDFATVKHIFMIDMHSDACDCQTENQ